MVSRAFGMLTALVVIASVAILATTIGCYDHSKDKRGRDARLNKLTGKLEVVQSDGKWATPEQEVAARLAADEAEKAAAEAEKNTKRLELPPEEAKNITGSANFRTGYNDGRGNFYINISNKSKWTVTEVDVVINILDEASGKRLIQRSATWSALNPGGFGIYPSSIGPQTSGSADFSITPAGKDQKWEWDSWSVRGHP